MSLTSVQLSKIRLIIANNPSPSYMAELANNDTFANSEISRLTPTLINDLIKQQTMWTSQQNSIAEQLTTIQTNLNILQTN